MDMTDIAVTGPSDAELLRDHALRWVAETYDDKRELAGRAKGEGFDRAVAEQIAQQGFLGVMVPEALGGTGGGLAEMAGIMEAVGRGIIAEPVLSVGGLAAPLLAALGTEASDALLSKLITGEAIAVLASNEPQGGFNRKIESQADGEGRITGVKAATIDLPGADVLLVSAKDQAGKLAVYAVDPAAAGVRQKAYRVVDGRTAASLTLDGVAGQRISGPDDVSALLDAAIDDAAFLVCAEAVGIMRLLVDTTAEFLKTRKQFGQTLDRFQVLQHRVVDMLLATEEAHGVVDAVVDAAPGPNRARAIALCKTVVARSARHVAQQSVQLHGGIGVTDELKIGRYFKRLMLCETLFGDGDFYFTRYEEARPQG